MSIFDIFSFKKEFAKVANKANFDSIKAVAREKIIEQVKSKIDGDKKMDNVVEDVTEWIEEHIYSDNKLVQWCIDNILIPDVRTICQGVYELLKEIVKGL